jgi:hypothetical protein
MPHESLIVVVISITLHKVKDWLGATYQPPPILARFRVGLNPSDDVDELHTCSLDGLMCKQIGSKQERAVFILVAYDKKQASGLLCATHALFENLQQAFKVFIETLLIPYTNRTIVALTIVRGAGYYDIDTLIR